MMDILQLLYIIYSGILVLFIEPYDFCDAESVIKTEFTV